MHTSKHSRAGVSNLAAQFSSTRRNNSVILRRDFNARVGEGDPFKEMMTEEREKRRSKDKNVKREGRMLIEGLKGRGWLMDALDERESGHV